MTEPQDNLVDPPDPAVWEGAMRCDICGHIEVHANHAAALVRTPETLDGRAIGRAMHVASLVGGPWLPCPAPYASPDCEHESMGLHVASIIADWPATPSPTPPEGLRTALVLAHSMLHSGEQPTRQSEDIMHVALLASPAPPETPND